MTIPPVDLKTRFRLRLDDHQITLFEGKSYELPFFIDNLGTVDLSLGISLQGFPAEWVSLPVPPLVSIRVGHTQLCSVNFTLPDQGSRSAGHYQGSLQVIDQGNPDLIQT